MAKSKATAADAQVIMQLYDLRREAELRKARNWIAQFHPQSVEDVLKVAMAGGTQENMWYRQALGYWDMAASLVLCGAVNADLFYENSGEMFFIFARFQPFVQEVRKRTNSPEYLSRVEKYVMGSKECRERLKNMQERVAAMRQRAMSESASVRKPR